MIRFLKNKTFILFIVSLFSIIIILLSYSYGNDKRNIIADSCLLYEKKLRPPITIFNIEVTDDVFERRCPFQKHIC